MALGAPSGPAAIAVATVTLMSGLLVEYSTSADEDLMVNFQSLRDDWNNTQTHYDRRVTRPCDRTARNARRRIDDWGWS